jgi:hypothetical protein
MQLTPFTRHLIPLRSKYPPQHPVLKHSQSMRVTVVLTDHRQNPTDLIILCEHALFIPLSEIRVNLQSVSPLI